MNSRQRIAAALNHVAPDRVPFDLGGSAVTGMHVRSVYQLRQSLRLDVPGTPVRVIEPYQMLGEIAPDLAIAFGSDVVELSGPQTIFGFPNEGWKPWSLHDGTPVLVPAGFNTDPEPGGGILMYPRGDRSAPPSGRMPEGGYYFDAIVRQEPIDDAKLDPADNLEEFGPIDDATLEYFARRADRLFRETDKAILADFGGTGFGDIAMVPAPWMRRPRGIRDVAEWYASLATRFDFVYEVFSRQCEIAIANLARVLAAVGDKVAVAFVTGTDFGTQRGPLIGCRTYRALFQPFHRRVNDWIHDHTPWKTFMHTCGSVADLIPDFVDAGFDVLNPLQFSAAGMDPKTLKDRFGDKLAFWGGGVDTQHTLPFGTPDDVRREVRRQIAAMHRAGGFVFSAVHNIQAGTPSENLIALFEAVRESRKLRSGGIPVLASSADPLQPHATC